MLKILCAIQKEDVTSVLLTPKPKIVGPDLPQSPVALPKPAAVSFGCWTARDKGDLVGLLIGVEQKKATKALPAQWACTSMIVGADFSKIFENPQLKTVCEQEQATM